jgi:hypothetical protein
MNRRYAIAATLVWVVTAVLVLRDWLTLGHADWVPFLGFTGLIILFALPVLAGKAKPPA